MIYPYSTPLKTISFVPPQLSQLISKFWPKNRSAMFLAIGIIYHIIGMGLVLIFILNTHAADAASHAILHLATAGMIVLGLAPMICWQAVTRTRKRLTSVENALNTASRDPAESVLTQFNQWGLTDAERGVAIAAMKGFSNKEIARMRATTEATIKCQMSAVYRKSGIPSRHQLTSFLVEEIMDMILTNSAITETMKGPCAKQMPQKDNSTYRTQTEERREYA